MSDDPDDLPRPEMKTFKVSALFRWFADVLDDPNLVRREEVLWESKEAGTPEDDMMEIVELMFDYGFHHMGRDLKADVAELAPPHEGPDDE